MKKNIFAIFALFLVIGLWGCGAIEVKGPDSLAFDEHMKLGSIYESKGEFELALREYDGALDLDKGRAEPHFAKGNVYLKQKDYAKAEAEYARAIEIDPSADYYNNLSWVYIEQGQTQKAEAAVRQSMALAAPEKGYVYLDTLGVVLMNAGEYEEAEESFLKAANSVADRKREAYISIYGHLAELYRKSGKDEQAELVEEKLELYKSSSSKPPGPGI